MPRDPHLSMGMRIGPFSPNLNLGPTLQSRADTLDGHTSPHFLLTTFQVPRGLGLRPSHAFRSHYASQARLHESQPD